MKFLIRCDPLPGESLSSLRYRTALANSVSFRDVRVTSAPPLDPDSIRNDEEVGWFESAFGRSDNFLRTMTLEAFTGPIFGRAGTRRHPPWLLQTKYSSVSTLRHTAYCAECLREGPAYFRLRWRLAVFTTCTRHGAELRDSCPACGFWIWPATIGRAGRLLDGRRDLIACPRCGESLAEVSVVHASSACDADFDAAIWCGFVELSSGRKVGSAGYFAALRAVCQLFMRNDSSALIERSGNSWAVLATQVRMSSTLHHVERLPTALRGKLLDAGHALLSDWPEAFLKFARGASLSYVHLSHAGSTYPDWFAEVLNAELRKQRRGVTRAHVEMGVAALRDRALKVTKDAVRRELGLGYPTALERLLPRRGRSTEDELLAVLGSYAAEFRGESKRRRVQISMLRDHVIFYSGLLSACPFSDVARWDRRNFLTLAEQKSSGSKLRYRVAESLRASWDAYLVSERELQPQGGASGGLYCPRGSGTRSAQHTLARHMSCIDPRLWRSVQVFWRVLDEGGSIS